MTPSSTFLTAFLSASLTACLAVGGAGCVSDRPDPAEPGPEPDREVRIAGLRYVPPVVEARVGERIEWTNEDQEVHTVTAEDGSFGSSTFGAGETFGVTLGRAGTFAYFCEVHPFMRGTLRVVG